MVHYYYGYGKGKTTAAMGLALRAVGHGQRVVIVQFLKDKPSGEIVAISAMPQVTVLSGKGGKGFTFTMTDAEKRETARIHNENLGKAMARVQAGGCDMLVLDEIGDALDLGLLNAAMVEDLLRTCPERTELVMTGHAPTETLVARADYVTEMAKHKHPYDRGVQARKGVEY